MDTRKHFLIVVFFSMNIVSALASISVTNVVIQQRWPWNGLVDIDYEVVSDSTNTDIYVYPVAVDHNTGFSILPNTLVGDGTKGPVAAGKWHMTWNMGADAPQLRSSSLSILISAFSGAPPYLVVDLSSGANATNYPVTYSTTQPALNNDACRTTNLWLRLVLPGTFIMGTPDDELEDEWWWNDEIQHQVSVTQPYYMGVFEITQKQWILVMGSNPSTYTGDARPVANVSFNMIRGTVNGAAWPANGQVDVNSFLGKLRARTAVTFDLPTEAQWEYACRAGTGTALNNGMNLTNTSSDASMSAVGRYYCNRSDGKGGYSQHTKVGSYLPNTWGLYDMHGNVSEWCLDWFDTYPLMAVTDPQGALSGSGRVRRGGGWMYNAWDCRSASRDCQEPGFYNGNDNYGLRIVARPAIQ